MAITETYLDVELATGLNDGTSEANAWQTWAGAQAGLVAGERLNVKNPSTRFDVSATLTFAQIGANLTPVHIRGYDTTIGDGVLAQMENLTLAFSGANVTVESLDLKDANATTATILTMSTFNALVYNCRVEKSADKAHTTPRCIYIQSGGNVLNCYCTLAKTSTISTGSQGVIDITNGVAKNNIVRFQGVLGSATPVAGILTRSALEHSAAAVRNLIYCDDTEFVGATVFGIYCTGNSTTDAGGYHLVNNTIHNFPVGIYIDDTGGVSTAGTSIYCNNLITACPCMATASNGTGVVPTSFFVKCASDGGFGSGIQNVDFVRLGADPYTDKSTADFSLNTTVGAGEACRARGASSTGDTLDIGAIAS